MASLTLSFRNSYHGLYRINILYSYDTTCALYDGQSMSTAGTAEPERFQFGRLGELF